MQRAAYIAVTEMAQGVALVREHGHTEDQTVEEFVVGGMGMLMLALVISALREAATMKRWPVAKGRVLSSKVEEYRADAGVGSYGGSRARMTLYRPVVV